VPATEDHQDDRAVAEGPQHLAVCEGPHEVVRVQPGLRRVERALEGAERLEELWELVLRDGVGEHRHVAVLLRVQPDPDLTVVVGDRLELDLDVRVDLLEAPLVVGEDGVGDVRAVREHGDLARDRAARFRAPGAPATTAGGEGERRDCGEGRDRRRSQGCSSGWSPPGRRRSTQINRSSDPAVRNR
jgi:hypothetical protein